MNKIEGVNILGVNTVPNSTVSSNNTNKPNIEYTELKPAAKLGDITEAIKNIHTDIGPTGDDVINYAKEFENTKYVYGSENPDTGLDCSAFTQAVYKKFGIDLPRYSNDQRSGGIEIASIKDALPGDLLCFNGHVGIYMGDNKMIHASSGSGKIKVQDNLDLYFHDMPLKSIRRIL